MRGLRTGDALETSAGKLKAKYVFHTVDPKHWEYPDGGVGLLRACYMNALAIADRLGYTSIAFPANSCGVYGWKVHDVAPIAINAVQSYWETHPDSVVEPVKFVLFGGESLNGFQDALESAQLPLNVIRFITGEKGSLCISMLKHVLLGFKDMQCWLLKRG